MMSPGPRTALFSLLGPELRRQRHEVAMALLLVATASLLHLPLPWLLQTMVDQATMGSTAGILPSGVALAAIVVMQAACTGCVMVLMGRVGLNAAAGIRGRIFERLTASPRSLAPDLPAGALLSRLMDDVNAIGGVTTPVSLAIVADLGAMAIALVWLAGCGSTPFGSSLIVLFAYGGAANWYRRRILTGAQEVRQRLDGIFQHLEEKLQAALLIRSHGQERREEKHFRAEIDAAHGPRLRLAGAATDFATVGQTLGALGVAAVFGFGAWELAGGRMTAGEALSAAAMAGVLFAPLGRLSELASAFETASASALRIQELFDSGAPAPAGGEGRLGAIEGRLELESVDFGFAGGPLVLREVSLEIAPRSKVALVGPTGCGKSTLLGLLLRLQAPNAGVIRLDSVPMDAIAEEDLRQHIGWVPQETIVFRDTLTNNIRFARPGATEEEVIRAARAAGVADWAEQLPDGFATVIGDGGVRLSRGQQQQIGIARVFCKDPVIVLLDEPTSNLDAASERIVQNALDQLLANRTSVTVTHRLATVRDADQIIVLHDGQVVQRGSHHRLLEAPDDLYYRLHQSQSETLAA